jgi:hypothetical protein
MHVLEAGAGQRLRQHADDELRVGARARDPADIDYTHDRRCLQDLDRLCDRTRRMPDLEDRLPATGVRAQLGPTSPLAWSKSGTGSCRPLRR